MKLTDKYVLFFTGKDIYSNFYKKEFIHQGIRFKWAEQAIMYRKARLFGASQIAEQILHAKTPNECKALGRSRAIPFDEVVWEENKMQIFKQILYDKFKTSPLREQMLSTCDRKFVEASPYDKIWGVGLSEDDPRVLDEKNWKGQNLLGQCLDSVKFELNKKFGQR